MFETTPFKLSDYMVLVGNIAFADDLNSFIDLVDTQFSEIELIADTLIPDGDPPYEKSKDIAVGSGLSVYHSSRSYNATAYSLCYQPSGEVVDDSGFHTEVTSFTRLLEQAEMHLDPTVNSIVDEVTLAGLGGSVAFHHARITTKVLGAPGEKSEEESGFTDIYYSLHAYLAECSDVLSSTTTIQRADGSVDSTSKSCLDCLNHAISTHS